MNDQSQEPDRSLGLLDAVMLGIGAMIGAGIFVLTGLAAEIAGPAAVLVFGLNGVVTTFTALSYAELASSVPQSGGGYAFVKEVLPETASFLMGWMLWFAYMIAGALYALGFASNFEQLLGLYGVHVPSSVTALGLSIPFGDPALALLVVVAFVVLNALSTSVSGTAETFVTILKVVVLLVFAAFGILAVNADNFRPIFPDGALAVLPAMGLTFIAFEGYDLITTVSEEIEEPERNIPKAIFISLAITVAVYVLVVFVALGTVGGQRLGAAGETAIAQAAATFMPRLPAIGSGSAIIAFGAVFSTITALNAVVLASSRVVFAMGRESQMPRTLGRVHLRLGTPLWAVLASAGVMLVAVAFVPIERVGNLASLFFLLSFVLVNVSLMKLRHEQPDLSRPFKVPFYPVTPILGIALNLVLSVFIDVQAWVLGAAWLAIGGIAYFLFTRGRGRR